MSSVIEEPYVPPKISWSHANIYLNALKTDYKDLKISFKFPPEKYVTVARNLLLQANKYKRRNLLENAFVLYQRYLTLISSQMTQHPDFDRLNYELFSSLKLNCSRVQKELKAIEKAMFLKKTRYVAKYNKELTEFEEYSDVGTLEDRVKTSMSFTRPILESKISVTYFPECLAPKLRLRSLRLPDQVSVLFQVKMKKTTMKKRVSVGILAGREVDGELLVTHLIIPDQIGGFGYFILKNESDWASLLTTAKSEEISEIESEDDRKGSLVSFYASEIERRRTRLSEEIMKGIENGGETVTEETEEEEKLPTLLKLGWIHTHPTEIAYLTSVDQHFQFEIQEKVPEAIAVVCASKYMETSIFTLTSHGLKHMINCRKNKTFHPHPTEPPMYAKAYHVVKDKAANLIVLDMRN